MAASQICRIFCSPPKTLNAISGAADVRNYSVPNQIIVSRNLIGGVKIATRYWSDSLTHLLRVWYFREINVCTSIFCHASIAHFCPLSTYRLYTSKHGSATRERPFLSHRYLRLKSQHLCHKFCIEASCKGLFHNILIASEWFSALEVRRNLLVCKRLHLCVNRGNDFAWIESLRRSLDGI